MQRSDLGLIPRACIQARDYCKKEESRVDGPWEFGEEPAPGTRNDLVAIKQLLDEGGSVNQVAEDYFAAWCRYRASFTTYSLMRSGKRSWQTHVRVYWGPPGTGKSRRAAFEGGEEAYWLNNTGGQVLWWDGYVDQKIVIIDDFYGWMKHSDMLRVIDRYPYAVQVRRWPPSLCLMM